MVELPMDTFLVWCSVRAVPRADHISNLEGVSPSAWQATPSKRVGKMAEGGCDLVLQGLTFVTADMEERVEAWVGEAPAAEVEEPEVPQG